MKIFCRIVPFALLFAAGQLFAQGTAINTTGNPPDGSALLDIQSNNKGILIPRMTQSERDAISNPAEGLQIYNTDTQCFNFYNGSIWKQSCYECDFSAPVVSSNGPLCEGATLDLSASAIPGATYSWTGPNGFTSSSQNPSISNVTAAANGVYNVEVSVNGCSSLTSSVAVTIWSNPSAAFNWSPTTPGEGVSTTFTPAVSGAASYSWTFPSGTPSSSGQENPSVSWAAAGSYTVGLTIVDGNGCSNSTSNGITVAQGCNIAGNSNTLDGPHDQYGFCWYLSKGGVSCDVVCSSLGGSNLANLASSAWPDNCSGIQSNDVSMYFYLNGNAGGWGSSTGSTSYHTLGYGYGGTERYGKCASGTSTGNGAFPGDTNNDNNRHLVCPCFQY